MTCPRFDRCPTPRTINHPDRYIQLFPQFTGVEISNRRKFRHSSGTTFLPAVHIHFYVFLRRESYGFLHLQQADRGIVSICHFLLVVHYFSPSGNGHFHIRLSGTDPYFARQDVVQHQFLPIRDSYLIRSSGRRSRDFYRKMTVGCRLSRIFFIIPAHLYGHLFTGLRFSR